MSVVLTINGVDRTKKVLAGSLKIENILTSKRDTCSFSVMSYPNNTLTPVLGQEVIVTLDGDKIFGGIITGLEQNSETYSVIQWDIECVDYTRLLDKKLVPEVYESMTVDAIIADLQANYMPTGFTINNVSCPTVINYIAFNYKPISKCLEELANLTNYDWYIDYDKDLHFISKTTLTAPLEIEDANASHRQGSLIIRKDNSQIRNSIIVRGGEFLGDTFTSEIECNGVDTIYPLAYKYTDFAATLTGQPLNVGTDNLDNPTDYDVLHNFNEKIVRFRDERTPSTGSILRVSGRPHLPVIVKYRSPVDISTLSASEGSDGIYEYLIIDKTINSKEGARQRAKAEITTYATTLSEGEFETETAGFRAGQRIRINSVARGIDEYFVINKVTFKQFTADTFVYKISLITTKTFDLIDLLSQLLLAETKKIVIDQNEVIDLVESISETVSLAETFTAQSLDYEVEFCAGTFTGDITTPLGVKRIFIVGGSPLG